MITIREDFAGAGGCSQGKLLAGLPSDDTLGVELDPLFASTAVAAGHARLVADVLAARDHAWMTLNGYTAGPPCQTFSTTGGRSGLGAIPALRAAVAAVLRGVLPEDLPLGSLGLDPRTLLTLEPALVIHRYQPNWILLEQVPSVLPVWRAYADELSSTHGYFVAVGIVKAERYRVPQTRRRAVLLASRDHHVTIPQGDDTVVTIGAAMHAADIDWSMVDHIRSNYGTGGDSQRRGMRRLDQPAMTMTGKANRNRVVYKNGSERPLTPREAGVLQGFPESYPWQGSPRQRAQQVGNSVPPPMSAAMIKELIS